MAKMQNPEVEVVRFAAKDVIATSGGVTLNGFGNTTNSDNTFTVGGTTYGSVTKNDLPGLIAALKTADGQGDSADDIDFYSETDNYDRLFGLWNFDYFDYDDFNGYYTWDDDYDGWKWQYR